MGGWGPWLGPVAFLVAVVAPGASAVNPIDNDGGTGGDAGDLARIATPVAPGTILGRLSPPYDSADYFSFPAARGDFLRVLFQDGGHPSLPLIGVMTPQESVFQFFADGATDTFLVPYSGTWLFWLGVPPLQVTTVHYRITFSLEAPPSAFTSPSPSGWQDAEVKWDQPGTFRAHLWTDLASEYTDPSSQFVMVEYWGDSPGYKGWVAFHLSTTATGRVLQASPLPRAQVPVEVQYNATLGGLSLILTMTSTFGSMRLTVYNTDPTSNTVITVAGTSPMQSASTRGEGLVLWKDSDASGSSQTLLPGYSSVGSRDRTLNVAGRFVGFFNTWGFSGYARKPDGTNAAGSFFTPYAAPGSWRFHLDSTNGVGFQADHVYLDGVFAPTLGLAPVWVCGPYGCM